MINGELIVDKMPNLTMDFIKEGEGQQLRFA